MRFKLLDMAWNLDEQYDMLTFPGVEWSWLIQYRVGYKRLRRDPEGLSRWVTYYEEGLYDAAILHLDLEAVETAKHAVSRRRVYEELNAVIQHTPKIVIVHGSCVPACGEGRSPREVRELIGDNYAVAASGDVAARLGVGHVIEPGIKADDWPDLPKEPRVVTNLAYATARDLQVAEALKGALAARDIELCRIGVDYVPDAPEDYRNFLGSSLLYLAPSPCRGRPKLEAMASGCCVLVHGGARVGDEADSDGQLSLRGPEAVVGAVEELIANPADALRRGQMMKTAVRRRYGIRRYSREWLRYLEAVLNGRTKP